MLKTSSMPYETQCSLTLSISFVVSTFSWSSSTPSTEEPETDISENLSVKPRVALIRYFSKSTGLSSCLFQLGIDVEDPMSSLAVRTSRRKRFSAVGADSTSLGTTSLSSIGAGSAAGAGRTAAKALVKACVRTSTVIAGNSRASSSESVCVCDSEEMYRFHDIFLHR